MAETETHVSSVYEGESVRSYGEATSRSNHTGAEDGAIDTGAAGEPPRRRWRYHNLDSALLEFLAFLAECSVPVVSIQDLTFGDASLGGGQTMKVLAGKFKGQDVAIKLFKQHAFKPGYTTREPTAMEDEAATFAKSLKDLTFEIRIMRHPQLISHPNIVRLHAVAFQDGLQVPRATSSSPTDETATDQTPRARAMRQEVWFPVLVLEPAAKSYPDLAQFFKAHAHTEGGVSQEVVSSLICDIAMGLSSLHKLGITHGDVKDDNILLFNNSEDTEGSAVVAKVADFGAAGIDAAREATRAQSRYWAAPEALERPSGWEGLRLTPEADVYSFGILAATIALRGRKVFDGVEAYTVKMNDEAAEHITTQLASFEASGESSFLKSIEKVVNRTVLVDRRKRLGDLSLVAELLGKRRGKHPLHSSGSMVPFHSYGTLAHPGVAPLATKVADTIYDQLPLSIKQGLVDLVHNFVHLSKDSQTMLVHIVEKMKGEPSLLDASDDLVRLLLALRLSNEGGPDEAPVPLEVDTASVGGFMQMYLTDVILGEQEEPKALKAIRDNDRAELIREVSQNPSAKFATMGAGWTGLHYCSFFNRPNLMDVFLGSPDGMAVDAAAGHAPAYTPLHIAAQQGNHECVKGLIDRGADVNRRSMLAGDFSFTPLQLAVLGAARGHSDPASALDTIRILLNAGASVDFRYRGLGVAHQLAQQPGGARALGLFLEHAPSLLSQLTPNKQIPLHSAAGSRNLAAVQLLLDSGADVHARNVAGDSPLHNAYMAIGPATRPTSRRFSHDFVRLLAGDEVDAREIIRLLILAGADEDAVGLEGIPWDTPEFRMYDEHEDASKFCLSPWEQHLSNPQLVPSQQWSFLPRAQGGGVAVFKRGDDKLALNLELPKTTPNYYEVQIQLACLDPAVQDASITILIYQEEDDTAKVLMALRLPLHQLAVNRIFTVKLRDFIVKHTIDLKMKVYEEVTPGRENDGPRRGQLLLDWIKVSKFDIMTVVGSTSSSPIDDDDL